MEQWFRQQAGEGSGGFLIQRNGLNMDKNSQKEEKLLVEMDKDVW